MEIDEDNTPQQQQEEGETDTGDSKKCSRKSDSLFPLSDSNRKAPGRQVQHKSLSGRDQYLRDQFSDRLFDIRLQQKHFEDETDRNFCDVSYRAHELKLIQKNSEERRGPLLWFFRHVRTANQG